MIRLTTERNTISETLRRLAANSRRITTYAASGGIQFISAGVRRAILQQGATIAAAGAPRAVRRQRQGHSVLVRTTVMRLRGPAFERMRRCAASMIQKLIQQGN